MLVILTQMAAYIFSVCRPKAERTRGDLKEESEEKKASSRVGSRPLTPVEGVPLYDKDLIRMLAEVNFVNGEVGSCSANIDLLFLCSLSCL